VLAGRPLAVTYAPVPGFGVRAARLEVAALHPWPWLRRPVAGSVASYTAWAGSVDGARRQVGARTPRPRSRAAGARRSS
jgi:deoxyribodipyrimidine photo-lyase